MKAFAITHNYNNEIKVVELELEEKAKTYKVIKRGKDFYGLLIKKDDINKFNTLDKQVVCFDLQEGLIVYEKGIEQLLKEEIERHDRIKNKLLNCMAQLAEIKNIE